MRHEQTTHAFVSSFVDELTRCGVRHVSVSPGSRSTPMALLLDLHPDITVWMHLDERSAAYFALGIAKSLREPAACLCTSGTAAANFLPAVVEARHSRVPLIVLTADRPPELQDVGANQTIDQSGLYGRQVKWSADVSLPEGSPGSLRYIRALACRAVGASLDEPRGPVHLNFPFREPLVPEPLGEDWNPEDRASWGEPPLAHPLVEVHRAPSIPDRALVDQLVDSLGSGQRGIVVCGPQGDPFLPTAVSGLSQVLGWPVLADPLSQARAGVTERSLVIDAYDVFLRDAEVARELIPDVVIRCGAAPTSKALSLYLSRNSGCHQFVVDGGSGWNDSTLSMTDLVRADPASLMQALTSSLISRRVGEPKCPTSWSERWLRANELARRAVSTKLLSLQEPFEGKVFAELAELMPDDVTLYVGNSMPVRDLDSFFPATARHVRILANRGASGIDGVVSSALGAASVATGRLVLVIGDLSLYHDLNGLLAAKQYGLDVTIVLLNNDGGGIFSFLPQAEHPSQFERLFGTPHGLDFRPVIEMYGGRFQRVSTWEEFREGTRAFLSRTGLSVIEMQTERNRNREVHREILAAAAEAVRNGLAARVVA